MATIVKGELYESLDGKLHELKRQIRQKGGYPFDPVRLDRALHDLIEGRLETTGRPNVNFMITYDQSLGLMDLIRRAVGPDNDRNINGDITQERFPLKGTDIRTVWARVERFIGEETCEQVSERLIDTGHTLANTGDLAYFFGHYPWAVEKWNWVVAPSEDSRWVHSDGHIWAPCARACGVERYFSLGDIRKDFHVGSGILVLDE